VVPIEGALNCRVFDTSGDGKMTVGYFFSGSAFAFKWVSGTSAPTTLLNSTGTACSGSASGISADGARTVGDCNEAGMGARPVSWSANDPAQRLTNITLGVAAAISSDGQVIVGSFGRKVGTMPFTTTPKGRATNLDGTIVIDFDNALAGTWWSETGSQPQFPLPTFTGTSLGQLSLNDSATTLVGGNRLWRSTTGTVALAIPNGFDSVEGVDVARSAPVAVGFAKLGSDTAPVVWNTNNNTVSLLGVLLTNAGIAVPVSTKWDAGAVSSDGRVVLGCATLTSGGARVFRVVLP
jgi:uncharacterized membrane protein